MKKVKILNGERPVTSQQRRFLTEYAECLDTRSAALRAGYSAKSALTQARELLGREKYLRTLDEIIAKKAGALDVCPAFVVKKYLELIFWASGEGESAADTDINAGISHVQERKNDVMFKTPKDPAILLRALDGLCKHLNRGDFEGSGSEESMLTRIIGLNQEKI